MNPELDNLKLQLVAIVEMLPPIRMEGSYTDTEDLVATLRTQAKYLLFDVEATRRENAYLREMLESRWKNPPDENTHHSA